MIADWIAIDIPWWAIVLGYIGFIFLPLTIATVVAAVAARRLRVIAVRIPFAVLLALWLTSAVVNLIPVAGNLVANIQVHQRHYVPGSHMAGDMTLVRDTTIDGVDCSSKGTLRTDFLGKLEECTLAHPQAVRGVPCTGRVNVEYRVRCVLGSSYERFGYTWREATLVRDNGADSVDFDIGPSPPTLAILGSPLAQNTEVSYNGGKLLSITFVDHPMHYRDCEFDQLLEAGSGFYVRCSGGKRLTLPQTTVSARAR